MKFVVTLLIFALSSAFASTSIPKEALVCLTEGSGNTAYLVSKNIDQNGKTVGIDVLYTFKSFMACQNSIKTNWVESVRLGLPEVQGELNAGKEACLYELDNNALMLTGNVYRLNLQSDETNVIKRSTLNGVYSGEESWENFDKCFGDLSK